MVRRPLPYNNVGILFAFAVCLHIITVHSVGKFLFTRFAAGFIQVTPTGILTKHEGDVGDARELAARVVQVVATLPRALQTGESFVRLTVSFSDYEYVVFFASGVWNVVRKRTYETVNNH